MCRFFLPLLFLLLVDVSAFAQELTADEQKDLLTRLQAQRREFPALTAEFTEEKTSELLAKPLVNSGSLTFEAPNKFRREVKGDSPSTTVCNGEKLWIYFPSFKVVELYTLGERDLFDDSLAAVTAGLNFTDVERFFKIKAQKEKEGYRVLLTPKSRGLKKFMSTLEIWADGELRLSKTLATLPKGERVTTTYKGQRLLKQVGKVFDFTPPAGVEISKPLGK